MISFPEIGYLGRLGNQMFQFASTVGIAKKLGLDARFPIENTVRYRPSGPFSPVLGRNQDIKCDLTEVFNIPAEYFIKVTDLKIDYFYNEFKFEFNPDVLSLPDNCGMNGYFQSEIYFKENRDLIISLFSFKSDYSIPAGKYIESIRENLKAPIIASIHVRRGDYLMYPDHHPVCTKEYYNRAIEYLVGKFVEVKFLVFSDDPEWCRKQFNEPMYVISDLKNPYTELCAMSLCNHHIIANSSFSWWGAWLNVRSDKLVIAPKNWFGPAINKNTQDVYCKDWISL